jgi:lysophospholipase L1-like esterase
MIAAHQHYATWMPPNDIVDFPVFAGGAPGTKGSAIIRGDVDGDSLRIRIIDHNGVVIHDWSSPPRQTAATTPAPLNADPKHYWWDAHRYRVNQVKTAPRAPDFVLLGDSIFHYWDDDKNQASWKTNFSGEGSAPYYGLNLAIEGDSTQSLLWRLQNGLLTTNDAPPKVAFVLIGTNNTGHGGNPDDTAAGVWAVVDHVKAATRGQTKIVVYGLLPRGKGAADPATAANRYVNRELKRFASARGYFYRDIGAKFLNKDGTVNRDLLYDGLHSGPKGFEVFAEDILKALKELKVPPARAGGTDNR